MKFVIKILFEFFLDGRTYVTQVLALLRPSSAISLFKVTPKFRRSHSQMLFKIVVKEGLQL